MLHRAQKFPKTFLYFSIFAAEESTNFCISLRPVLNALWPGNTLEDPFQCVPTGSKCSLGGSRVFFCLVGAGFFKLQSIKVTHEREVFYILFVLECANFLKCLKSL